MIEANLFFEEYTKDLFFDTVKKDYYLPSDCEDCVVVKDAFILPTKKKIDENNVSYFEGGVVNNRKEFVKNSQFLRSTKSGALISSYDFSTDDVNFIDKNVLYAGILINHFGHFLVEGLSRLWYWCENRDKDLDIAFLMPKNQVIFPQFREFMELMGIDKSKVHIIKKVTRFKEVHVPRQTHILGTSYDDKFLVPYRYISSLLPSTEKTKYYLSRRKFKTGTLCFGEQLLENLYKKNGFKIVYPEKLSLVKQLTIIKNASELAGVSGTAMHMVLFANEGIDVTILERSDVPVEEQVIINQATNVNSYYVGVNINPLPVDHSIGPTMLTVNDAMVRYCNIKGLKFDKNAINYVKTNDGKKFIKLWLKYYSQIDNNNALAGKYPLIAKRFMFIAKAFTPLKKIIKYKIKNLQKKLKN